MNPKPTAASRGNQQSIVNASEPKERPILFSGPMVKAILEGRKTQTRRIVKGLQFASDVIDEFTAADPAGFWAFDKSNTPLHCVHCPYGQPGERLWVRESHALLTMMDGAEVCAYRASCDDSTFNYTNEFTGNVHCIEVERWRPSIHMTRAASRITLEIVDIRIERLASITVGESIKEGITIQDCRRVNGSAVDAFRNLWESINGPDSWVTNPLVWVVDFKRV